MIGPYLSILVCDWPSEGMIDHLDLTSTTVDTESELIQMQIAKFGIPETIAGDLITYFTVYILYLSFVPVCTYFGLRKLDIFLHCHRLTTDYGPV